MRRVRTKILKIHEATYNNFLNKKVNMAKTLNTKPDAIKWTQFMDFISTRTIYADDNELRNYFLKQKKRRNTWVF